MPLVDHEIAMEAARGLITPFEPTQIKRGNVGYGLSCCGYDCRIAGNVKHLVGGVLDPKHPERATWQERTYADNEPITLLPGDFLLARTVERFAFPRHLMGQFLGKSTLARCGLLILATPAEPGWCGYLTLELVNPLRAAQIDIYAGQGIGQMLFWNIAEPDMPYDKRSSASYQNQEAAPVVARVRR